MNSYKHTSILVCVMSVASIAHAQGSAITPLPTTKAAVGQWDAKIVERAEQILASPAQWNRANTSARCPAAAETFSITCALERAVEQAVGVYRDQRLLHPASATTQPPPLSDCRLHAAGDLREGSCGVLFDEAPIFEIAHVKAITSGTWRSGVQPTEVWAGTMADAESPVMEEARRAVDLVTTKKYPGRLIGYNNDSATTFADVQAYFRVLRDRVVKEGATDLSEAGDSVEIEIYSGGTGLIRMYNGWFPITGFSVRDSLLRFQIDTARQVPPSVLDREILVRAATIISSDSVWNRADNRQCAQAVTTWSIYCAVERAEVEVTGGFHHRRPAMELVREIVDERTKAKPYKHRLMEYNNDPSTHLQDVRTLFAEAIARIK